MFTIVTANHDKHKAQIQELFFEYLQWINIKLIEVYLFGIDDVAKVVDNDFTHIDKFMPPMGRLLLVFDKDRPAAMACLKSLEPGIGEIKRMYVRPAYRRQGLGRRLLNRLLEEAAQIGYHKIRLDSAPFLPESHQLYRTSGFHEMRPYEGCEVPKEFHTNWLFMEKSILNQGGQVE